MFNNIGGKIKGLVQIIFWIEAVAAVIAGLSYAGDTMGFSILIAAFGILILWISTWIIYGYGEIIETLTEIKCNLKGESAYALFYNQTNLQRKNNLEDLRNQGLITEEDYQAAILKNK